MSNSVAASDSNRPASKESDKVEVAPQGSFFRSEDWLAMVFGFTLLAIGLGSVWLSQPTATVLTEKVSELKGVSSSIKQLSKEDPSYEEQNKKLKGTRKRLEGEIAPTPLKAWVVKPGSWEQSPNEAFYAKEKLLLPGLLATMIGLGLIYTIGMACIGQPPMEFAIALLEYSFWEPLLS